jgi:hypothetical protein
MLSKLAKAVRSRVARAAAVVTAVVVPSSLLLPSGASAAGLGSPPVGTSIINLTSISESVTKEIESNLPTIETVFGLILVIAVLFRLYKRFVA